MNFLQGYFGYQKFEDQQDQQEHELFYSNSKQRKEEALKLLREWARETTAVIENTRELLENFANKVDYQSRLSVDLLQVAYRFFHEKHFQEQQYAQFLLTKPLVDKYKIHQSFTKQISQFEQENLKRQEKIGLFAHKINSTILKSEMFSEFAEMDKKSEVILSAIVIQRKLIASYIRAAGNCLAQIVPPRQRKPIFENKTQQILSNISTLGTIITGTLPHQQDPNEEELERQIEEQNKQQAQIRQLSEAGLSNGEESIQNEQVPSQMRENVISSINEIKADQSPTKEDQVNQEQENIQPQQLSNAEKYIQRQNSEQSSQGSLRKSKSYKPEEQPLPNNNLDLFRLMISFIYQQQQAIQALNKLGEKSINYWQHVQIVENQRNKWAKEACRIYREGVIETYGTQIEELDISFEENYDLKELIGLSEEDLNSQIKINNIQCQAPKLLCLKEFKVFFVDKVGELPALLIVTIDQFAGCWCRNDFQMENIDNPIFHLPIKGMALVKDGLFLDVMPSKHVLFLNIANDRRKTRIRFSTLDDMEEFCTIVR
ncbi:hypothetical protein pb186bvf_007038 [Paramecium bursaria]